MSAKVRTQRGSRNARKDAVEGRDSSARGGRWLIAMMLGLVIVATGGAALLLLLFGRVGDPPMLPPAAPRGPRLEVNDRATRVAIDRGAAQRRKAAADKAVAQTLADGWSGR